MPYNVEAKRKQAVGNYRMSTDNKIGNSWKFDNRYTPVCF